MILTDGSTVDITKNHSEIRMSTCELQPTISFPVSNTPLIIKIDLDRFGFSKKYRKKKMKQWIRAEQTEGGPGFDWSVAFESSY